MNKNCDPISDIKAMLDFYKEREINVSDKIYLTKHSLDIALEASGCKDSEQLSRWFEVEYLKRYSQTIKVEFVITK